MARPLEIIGLGELLWDDFPDGRRPGGAPANVAFHAAQLGHRGRIASRVGRDAAGEELLAFLRSRGLDCDLIQPDDRWPTGRVSVAVSAAGQPSFVIHTDVAWDHLQASPDWLAAAADADAICFGTLAQRSADSRQAVQQMLQEAGAETLLVFDVNLRQQWYDKATIELSLQHADVVKLNDTEAETLGRLLCSAPLATAEFAARLQAVYDVATVVVTRGEHGCWVRQGDCVVDVPGQPVQVVDTVGAGDAFTAAFITGCLRGWPLARTARFANQIGGLVAARPGAMPDIRADIAAIDVSG